MSDETLTPRGIEVDRVHVVAIHARQSFVSVCTRRLPQPLGREAWLHAIRLLVGAGLKVWPDATDAVYDAVAQTVYEARRDARAA